MSREPWVRVHARLIDRPVVARMSADLRIDPFKAMGHLITFWGCVSANAKNGHVAPVADDLIERWAGWKGKKGAFAAWVRRAHLDENGRVNEWDAYQGRLEERRERDRIRADVRRKSARHPHDVGTTSARSPDPRARTVRNGVKYRGISEEEGGALGGAPPPDPNRERNEAELAAANKLRVARGERPLEYGEVYNA